MNGIIKQENPEERIARKRDDVVLDEDFDDKGGYAMIHTKCESTTKTGQLQLQGSRSGISMARLDLHAIL